MIEHNVNQQEHQEKKRKDVKMWQMCRFTVPITVKNKHLFNEKRRKDFIKECKILKEQLGIKSW